MENIKIHTLVELKRLEIGTKLKLVGLKGINNYKSEGLINEIVDVDKLGFKLSYGALTFPDKKGFESWDKGFIIKKGMNTSIPTILKFEVLK